MNPASLQVNSSSSNLTVNQSDGDMRESGTHTTLQLNLSPRDGELGRLILNYYLWSRCRKKQG